MLKENDIWQDPIVNKGAKHIYSKYYILDFIISTNCLKIPQNNRLMHTIKATVRVFYVFLWKITTRKSGFDEIICIFQPHNFLPIIDCISLRSNDSAQLKVIPNFLCGVIPPFSVMDGGLTISNCVSISYGCWLYITFML